MSLKAQLKPILASLRRHTATGSLNAAEIGASAAKLAKLGYAYDEALFPPLPSNHKWKVPPLEAPHSLAEALLWKMGKWKIYKSFVAHYDDAGSVPKNTDVVFYAFAKHLKNPTRPIYDQHALRALWAIDAHLTAEQASTCRKLLAKKNGTWRPIVSGSTAPTGYSIYTVRVADLCKSGIDHRNLDKLLMPLGQALKDCTKGIEEFIEISGCAG